MKKLLTIDAYGNRGVIEKSGKKLDSTILIDYIHYGHIPIIRIYRMSRPPKCRWVGCMSEGLIYKPCGIPLRNLKVISLQLDELEALRQAHLEGKSQEEGAELLGVSRSTFGRILESAHQKITDAFIHEKAINIHGGPIIMDKRTFECKDCGHTWEVPFGTGRPPECPSCKAQNFYRTDAGQRQRGACKHGPRSRSRRGRN